jgi:hypothetical protein
MDKYRKVYIAPNYVETIEIIEVGRIYYYV